MDIESLRMQIKQLEQEIREFENLKTSLSGSVVPKLTQLANTLNKANGIVPSAFIKDNEPADKKSIENNAKTIENLNAQITGSVYPAIDAEIAKRRAKIAQLQAQINAILAALAAAAAAAKEASSKGGR